MKREFTLKTLLWIVAAVAVLIVIAVPILTDKLEKERLKEDNLNVRQSMMSSLYKEDCNCGW